MLILRRIGGPALVFISHSRQNSSAALKLCDELTRRGVKTWLDVRDLDSGLNWNEPVGKAIREAAALIFVIGPSGGPVDQWQRFEWQQVVEEEYYLDASKPLIPIVIGDVEISGFLKIRQAILISDSINIEKVASKVLEILSKPSESVDAVKLQRGIEARAQGMESLRKYSLSLQVEDVKRAGLEALR